MNNEEDKLLTERELDVLICIHKGLSNPQIARKLCISISTVKAHISKILLKMRAKNRFEVLLMLVGERSIANIDIKNQIIALHNKQFSKI